MRSIHVDTITQAVRDLCIEANVHLPADLQQLLQGARDTEPAPLGRELLCDICENFRLAAESGMPICQDTGLAVVFAEVGQEVHIEGGLLADAVNRGVARGYTEGYLRCSSVGDPLRRVNTGDNTPAILHTTLVEGDTIRLTVAPKGAGSENMSTLRMLTPASGRAEVIDYVVRCVEEAGSNPCPPIVVGVGIGGNFELCALLAKRALCAPVGEENPDPYYREMEAEILQRINATGIGPQGFGGRTTALAVKIEAAATHIASLPVAVNIGCHVTRHATRVL